MQPLGMGEQEAAGSFCILKNKEVDTMSTSYLVRVTGLEPAAS